MSPFGDRRGFDTGTRSAVSRDAAPPRQRHQPDVIVRDEGYDVSTDVREAQISLTGGSDHAPTLGGWPDSPDLRGNPEMQSC
jgi:hypothetical protein